MDTQMVANALLLIPAVIFGIVAIRARRRHLTTLGLGLRPGSGFDFGHGFAFGAVLIGVAVGILAVGGLLRIGAIGGPIGPLLGILLYFFVLFVVEEVVFRGLLMTGLGVVVGQLASLVIVSVLVAVPYAFAEGSGVLPVVGAVLTNLVTGLARWRTGRIWFGVGMRLAWNGTQVALGIPVSGYLLATPVVRTEITGPAVLTGGAYGPEGGLVGIGIRVVMLVLLAFAVRGRTAPWTVMRRSRAMVDAPA